MKAYYKKHNSRLEILGIACLDTKEKWVKAVHDNQLDWLNVIDNKNDKVAVKYAIRAYPTKIILNKDKNIIAVFVGESDEFYQKLDELLK